MASDWDEHEHPRWDAGTDRGGQFRGKLAAGSAYRIMAETMPGWVAKVSQRLTGSSVGYWQRENIEDYRDRLFRELSRDLPSDVVESLFADYDWPAGVWRSGDHLVTIHSPEMLHMAPEILRHIDELQTRFPIGQPIRLSVVPSADIGGASGEAVPGTGILYVAEETFHPKAGYVTEPMPVGRVRGVPKWKYAMTHEWGHLIDTSVRSWYLTPGGTQAHSGREAAGHMLAGWGEMLSPYGREEGKEKPLGFEAVAEAFTEWYLTAGQTGNEGAQAYARWQGWEWRW